MTTKLRRVVTYERVSSDNQRERETIKTQTEELARRLGADPAVQIAGRYVDDGVSGALPLSLRPDGRRLLEDAMRGLFDELWVYKLDRLGRDDIDPLIVRRQLESLGVRLFALHENIESPLEYQIRVAFAAEERRTFLLRSAAGMNRAAREGRYCGGIVPLGYMVDGRQATARLVPSDKIVWGDWTEADLVRRIYKRLAMDGWSCRQIAEELNALGVPTAYQKDGRLVRRGQRKERTQGRWRSGRIRNLVVNPVYRGELQYGRRTDKPGREVISAKVPRLVSDEVWYGAQETLAGHRITPNNTPRVYLLRSVIKCGICGLNYVSTRTRDQLWYRCNGYLKERGPIEGRCPSKGIKGTNIEPVVWADIKRFLRDPGDLIAELEREREMDSTAALVEAERTTLQAALHSLDRRRTNVIDLREHDLISDGEMHDRLRQIENERCGVEARLAALDANIDKDGEPQITEDLAAQLRRRLDEGLSDAERQEIVRLLVKRITAYTEPGDDAKMRVRAVIEYRFPVVAEISMGMRAVDIRAVRNLYSCC